MKKKPLLIFGIGLLLIFVIVSILRKDTPSLQLVSGQTMGTIAYNVKYMGMKDDIQQAEVDDLLVAFNQSLSTYISDSEISILNQEGTLAYTSNFFFPVLAKSKQVFDRTGGTFDPTVAPLIDAWGFGPEKQVPDLDSVRVDTLLSKVGFRSVSFDSVQVSMPTGYRLDFSAIAKGYAVDLVAELLESKGIDNYLVEIGGEVRSSGVNKVEKTWSLGIEDPRVAMNDQKLLIIVRLKDRALATSGNYRNYYEKEGRIFAHIIDPRTGYTANHQLLSASVFAQDCMTADAYATALMVLGLDESKRIVESEDLDAILVYQNDNGQIKSYISGGIKPFVELNKAQ